MGINPQNELERTAQAIASVMECRLCPSPCKAKEHSSMANCASRWVLIMTHNVLHPDKKLEPVD